MMGDDGGDGDAIMTMTMIMVHTAVDQIHRFDYQVSISRAMTL